MSRRHFGSVRKLPSGRWQALYWHQGQLHTAPDTFTAKADALAYLANVETDIRRGGWVDPRAARLTVAELGKEWLASDPRKRQSTKSRDETILRRHIVPEIGKAAIGTVTKIRVQSLVSKWSETQAPRTVQRQYDVLRAMFNYAVENDKLARSPSRGIKEPETPQPQYRTLSRADVTALANATPAEYRPMVYLGAVLGLRWGEVAGLTVGALDLERSRLAVSQQLGRDHALVAPKSRAGVRTMTMPVELTELLKTYLGAGGLVDPSALIFATSEGGPLDYANWRRRVWTPAVEKAGLAGARFHDLRRTNATALVQSGVDVKTAQARLGHSDPRLTLAVYAQATSEADRFAADQLGERFLREIAHVARTTRKSGTKQTARKWR